MSITSIGVTEGSDEQIVFDSTASGNVQCVKLLDPTAASTTGIGVAANPMHVQAASLPLPSGAASAANQSTIIGHLDGVEGGLSSLLSELQLKADLTETQPISAASLPLPSGAATSALQTTGNTTLSTISGTLSTLDAKFPTEGQLTDDMAKGSVSQIGAFGMYYDGSTWDMARGDATNGALVNLGANNDVAVTSSALPSGAATSANQTTIIGHVDGIETALTTLNAKDFATQTTLAAINAKLVTGTDIGDVTINNASGASAVNIQDGGNSITVDGTVAATQSGTWNITNISGTVSLPTGAATAALQTTLNGHVDGIEALLTTIDADTSNLSVVGGGTEAAAIRVTIANNSTGVLSVDDNGSTLSIDDGGGTITVDGTVVTTPESATNPATAPVATTTNVTTGAAVTLLASNVNRKKAYVQMLGNSDVYVKYGTGAAISSGNYHVQLDSKSSYMAIDGNIWNGAITAIASGTAIDCVAWEVV